MGLLGKKKEKCPACDKPFEDHDEYVNHITNIHPPHKPCPKCQNIMYWKLVGGHAPYCQHMVIYICSDCGFIGESWVYWDSWNDRYVKKRLF